MKMTNRSTKRALLTSIMAMVLCVAMLAGTTFAWFTDSVTSSNNIIKSGTLDVTMEWLDGKSDPNAADATWKDASSGAIFNSQLWEPGYTEVRHIKIANVGTLALKYQLNIIANGEVSDLADVIDVYYIDPAVNVTDRAQLNANNKIGTLSEVLKNLSKTANGNLEANTAVTITLALKMQETAGNDYQNKSIGSSFSIQLLATQYTSEDDSFDNQYDAGLWVGGVDTTWYTEGTTEYTITTAEQLAGLAELVNAGNNMSGVTFTLGTDIDLANIAWTPIGTNANAFAGTFNGNGHTISNLNVSGTTCVGLFGNVFKGGAAASINNVNVDGANVVGTHNVGVIAGGSYLNITGCTITNANVIGYATDDDNNGDKVGGIVGYLGEGSYKLENNTVRNTTIRGYRDVGGIVGATNSAGLSNNKVENTTISYVVDKSYASAGAITSGRTGITPDETNVATNVNVEKNTVNIYNSYELNNLNTADLTGEIVLASNAEYTLPSSISSNVKTIEANGASVAFADGKLSSDIVVKDAVITSAVWTSAKGASAKFYNCTFTATSAFSGAYCTDIVFDGCTFKNSYKAIHFEEVYDTLTVTNCVFESGRVMIGSGSDAATAKFENCAFGATTSTSIWSEKGIRTYVPTVFTDCEFNNRVVMAGSNGLALTFENCKMNDGLAVTDAIIAGGNVPTVTIK